MRKCCAYCGTPFDATNVRRLYCSDRCRRDADNARKRGQRAEERHERGVGVGALFPDPWERHDPALEGGSILEAWAAKGIMPCGLAVCVDYVLSGPDICSSCPMR